GTNLVSVSDNLSYAPTAGRLRFLEGQNGSVVIDDTYNAAPQAMHQAIEVFSSLDTSEARCVAILGDMKELGEDTIAIHKELVKPLMEYVDVFVGVGECMNKVSNEMEDEPFIETISFETSQEAAEWAKEHIQGEDIVVVKGAQSMRMERVVKSIMAYPEYAPDVLVRQDKHWK
ncbi:MAG: glutamate ligase domain-containing protein, partial [Candidatus Paceibacteria bacterium]